MRQRNYSDLGATIIIYLLGLLAFVVCTFAFASVVEARVVCVKTQRVGKPTAPRPSSPGLDCFVRRPPTGRGPRL